MSLIDPKHLVAPFQNTIHIVAIVFGVLLFAVFRLATGGLDIENPAEELRAAAKGQVLKESPKVNPNAVAALQGATGAPAKTNEPSNDSNPQDLQDIERALGLKK